jgi:cyanophycinase
MNPKGKLLIIGGAEDKVGEPPDMKEQMKEYTRYEIINELVPDSKNKKVEIVTTGSEVPEEVKKSYQKVFFELGYKNIGFIPIKLRAEAKKKDYLLRVQKQALYFLLAATNLDYPLF